MSRSAEIVLSFAGEDRTFRLPLGRIRALQEKCDAGPMELLVRFAQGTWRVDDLRETIHQGLLGGGMDVREAAALLKNDFDDLPLKPFIALCQAIVGAAVVGAPDERLGESEAGEEAEVSSRSPAANSASPPSTEAEPS
jgi:hypothetical protein